MRAARVVRPGALLVVTALLCDQASAATKPAPVDLSGKFTIYIGGKPVASEVYSVKKTRGKLELEGSGQADLGTIKVNIEHFSVVVNDKFQPISAGAKATLGQVHMDAVTTFHGGTAVNQIDRGQGPQPKEDTVHQDAIVVNSNLPLFPWTVLMLRARVDTLEPQQFFAYVIGQNESSLTVMFKGKETVAFADRTVDLNHFAANFTPNPNGGPIEANFWVDDHRKIIKVAVPAQAVEAYQEGFARKEAAPPAPKPEAQRPPAP
jgi:hypothetical protein